RRRGSLHQSRIQSARVLSAKPRQGAFARCSVEFGVGIRVVSEYAYCGRSRGASPSEAGEGSGNAQAFPDYPRCGIPFPAMSLEPAQILIVDDAIEAIETLDIALGGNVSAASSAEEALAILDSKAIAGVITDIQLPRMSGLELIARIREQPRFRHL